MEYIDYLFRLIHVRLVSPRNVPRFIAKGLEKNDHTWIRLILVALSLSVSF
jgi:hypothetical protein